MPEYIYDDQMVLFGKKNIIGFGDSDFYISEIDRDLANSLIVKNHYSHKYYSASYVHLGTFINRELIGVLQYGYAMNPASCGSVVKGTNQDEYLELNRMWMDDKAPRNTESKAISYSIKYFKEKLPKIKWIQSFADERCGKFGIVYQAANFRFFGEHIAIFWTLDNVIYHNSLMTRNPSLSKSAKIIQDGKDRATSEKLRQFRYIYFIKKSSIKNCLLKEKSYPKYYEEIK